MKRGRLTINKGFSLVELMVAVSIFIVFVSSSAGIIFGFWRQARNAVDKERATYLAAEALEASRNLRDADFANLIDGTHGLSLSDNQWTYTGSSDLTDIFTRSLTISTINIYKKKLESLVSWNDSTYGNNSVTLSTYLTKWNYITPQAGLTINKNVINHGLSKTTSDFAPYLASTTVYLGDPPEPTLNQTEMTPGEATILDAGQYIISETTDSDYSQTFSGDCDAAGNLTLNGGDAKICNITNEEKPSYLTVTKIVNGGPKQVSDFYLFVDAIPVTSGNTNTFNSGLHAVSETSDPSYSVSFSGDCNSSGQVTLVTNTTKSCTLTNTFTGSPPTVITTTPSDITQTTASSGGNVTADGGSLVTARGVAWSTSENPTIIDSHTTDGSGLGLFTSSITGLTCNTFYHVRAYATNSIGTSYGADLTFTTTACNVVPTVTSPTATSVVGTSATLGANVTSLGIPALISARGICYGTSPNPTTNCTPEGGTTLGVFTQLITGLTPGTLYYYRGYATNSTGTGYSVDGTFTTLGGSCAITGITPTTYDSPSSRSALVSKPTGVVQNDIMFAYVLHNNAIDRLNSIPVGWVELGRHKNGNSNQALFYKIAGASEPLSYTFGLSANSRFAITINAYRGCFNITNPIDTFSNTEYVVNNTTYRAASMNLPSQYTTIIMFPSVNASGSKKFASPLTQGGGWIEDYTTGNSSSQFSRSAFSKLMTSAGATGVIDSIGFSASTGKHAFAVGLKPVQ